MQKDRDIIFYLHITEKTSNVIDKENKLEFIVRRDATKTEIKKNIEKIYDVKVESVNIKIGDNGKHAIIKLKKEFSARDIATRLGVI